LLLLFVASLDLPSCLGGLAGLSVFCGLDLAAALFWTWFEIDCYERGSLCALYIPEIDCSSTSLSDTDGSTFIRSSIGRALVDPANPYLFVSEWFLVRCNELKLIRYLGPSENVVIRRALFWGSGDLVDFPIV
jgi:hypothetical protein